MSTFLLLLFLVVIIVLQQLISLELHSLMGRALLNSAHTPWFFAISIGLWLLLDRKLNFPTYQKVIVYLGTLLVLATALEAVQLLNHRQASLGDVLRNLVGATAAALSILAYYCWRDSRKSIATGLVVVAMLVFLTGFRGVGQLAWLRMQLLAQAPVLVEFREPESGTYRILRGSWTIEQGISGWQGYEDSSVARVDLSAETRWPGLVLREPLRDWRPYSWLIIDAFSPLAEPLPLDIRLQVFENPDHDSIYSLQLLPGANSLKIPLTELATDVQSLGSIRNLLLYKEFDGDRTDYFYLGQIRLD